MVISPRVDRRAGQGQGMGLPSDHLGGSDDPGHLDGSGLIRRRSIPELPITVQSPGPDRAVGLEGEAMGATARHGLDPGQSDHLYGGEPLDRRPIPELAVVVVPPCPDCAIGLQGKAIVLVPTRDRDDPGQVADPYRRWTIRECPIPKLVAFVHAPCPDRTIGLERQAVVGARRDDDNMRPSRLAGWPIVQ